MSPEDGSLPTLTEVIDLALQPMSLPITGDAALNDVNLGGLRCDDLAARLQPHLEAWLETRVRTAMLELAPAWTEAASRVVTAQLRSDMPALLAQALHSWQRPAD